MGCGNSKEAGNPKDKKVAQKGKSKQQAQEQTINDPIKQEKANKRQEEGKKATGYTIRKDINTLSEQELERFFKAVRQMMVNKEGPGTSDFFVIAGYHGWPSDYCQHGAETFPVWHRAFLIRFEEALKEADKALGNDGTIGLPYWDWTQGLFPEKILDMHKDFPEDFFPADIGEDGQRLKETLFTQRRPYAQIQQYVDSSNAALEAKDALLTTEHWKYASTRWRGNGVSVESSHNSIHMACGYPMSSIAFAAFDILFWLHHCNVDRFFEKYIQLEPDSYDEFDNTQKILHEQYEEPNRAEAALDPFINPKTKQPFMPSEGYQATENLGFKYQDLPPTPVQEMREFPTLAVFENINTLELEKKSYLLHVFVAKKGEQLDLPSGFENLNFKKNKNYGGWGAIFGGKGKECSNCKLKKPFHIFVNITKTLGDLQLLASQAELQVVLQDEYSQFIAIDGAKGIPKPVIHGPFFEDGKTDLHKEGNNEELNKRLQKYLTVLGFYESEQDGVFGEHTDQAVQQFQNFHGLKVDGVVGPETKKHLLQSRNDHHPDNSNKSGEKANLKGIETLKVFLGTIPGYLYRDKLIQEILQGIQGWNGMAPIFKAVEITDNRSEAHLSVLFKDRQDDNLFAFDKVGGNLAFSTDKEINFDISDRWVHRDQQPRVREFKFYSVFIHEFGHVLGLGHSNSPMDIMSPFYNAQKQEVQTNDIERLAQLYELK